MDLARLVKEWLIEKGFRDYQIEIRAVPGGRSIIVYLRGLKLYFIIDGFNIVCTLMSGGLVTPIDPENFLRKLVPWTDLRDPKSFEMIDKSINRYYRKSE